MFLETAKSLGSFRGIRAAWRSELVAQVAELRKPTLVVWGERDLILPATHLEAARTLLPHAESHLFTGTGHMPQIERADDFAALVRPFLAGQASHSERAPGLSICNFQQPRSRNSPGRGGTAGWS